MSTVSPLVVRSLAQFSLVSSKNRLLRVELQASEDLICKNVFCHHLSGPCLCRLERALASLPSIHTEAVEYIDLSRNNLERFPPSLARCVNLQHFDFSNNSLGTLSDDDISMLANFKSIKSINFSNNKFTKDSIETLFSKESRLKSIVKY